MQHASRNSFRMHFYHGMKRTNHGRSTIVIYYSIIMHFIYWFLNVLIVAQYQFVDSLIIYISVSDFCYFSCAVPTSALFLSFQILFYFTRFTVLNNALCGAHHRRFAQKPIFINLTLSVAFVNTTWIETNTVQTNYLLFVYRVHKPDFHITRQKVIFLQEILLWLCT